MTVLTQNLTGRASPVHDPRENGMDDGSRIAEYTRWRSFAYGDQWQGRQRPGETRLTFNYARTLVRKIASYVFPDAVTFSIGAESTTGAGNANEKRLARLVHELDLPALDLELEIERSICGDAAVKVTWDAKTKLPKVVSVDPATIAATWSPDDPKTAQAITQTYQLPGWALLPYGIDVAADKQLHTVIETWTADRWTIAVSGTDFSREVPNPYGWIPYVVLPNEPHPRQFWGRSDLIEIEDAAREFNRELSVLARIMEISGAPIAVLENVDGSEGIRTGPGAKWELPEGSKAYLLDLLAGQGVRLHVDYVAELRTTMHDLSETPRTAFGDTGRQLSGAALQIELQPLIQRVMRKRLGWNRFYRERNAKLLDLLATFGGEPIEADRLSRTNWPNVLPSDDEVMARTQVQLVAANIRSRRTAMAELGTTDPDGELTRILDELDQLRPPALDPEPGKTASDDDPKGQESKPGPDRATDP